jgi:protein phosphatase
VELFKLDVAMRTDKGVVRDNNEDAIGYDPDARLVVLADGMGGANAGEIASRLAIDMLLNQLAGEKAQDFAAFGRDDLQLALSEVNRAIQEIAWQVPEYQGMGTTLVMGLFNGERLLHAHVGDSRLYRYRNGVLEVLTSDHTLIQEMIDQGGFDSMDEALEAGVPPNVLTRAFGSEVDVPADIAEVKLTEGDLFLFCSDGLTNMVSDRTMERILGNEENDLAELVERLIEEACDNGGTDNVSVILAKVLSNDG